MKNNLSFDEAWAALNKLVADLEDETIPLDDLAAKVKDAKILIGYCDAKLKGIEADLKALKDSDEEAG